MGSGPVTCEYSGSANPAPVSKDRWSPAVGASVKAVLAATRSGAPAPLFDSARVPLPAELVSAVVVAAASLLAPCTTGSPGAAEAAGAAAAAATPRPVTPASRAAPRRMAVRRSTAASCSLVALVCSCPSNDIVDHPLPARGPGEGMAARRIREHGQRHACGPCDMPVES